MSTDAISQDEFEEAAHHLEAEKQIKDRLESIDDHGKVSKRLMEQVLSDAIETHQDKAKSPQDLKDKIFSRYGEEQLKSAFMSGRAYIEKTIEELAENNPNIPNNPNKANKANNPNKDEKELDKQRLLQGERPEFKQLKGGIHDDQYYFGTSFHHEQSDSWKDAVITSDGDLYVHWNKKNNEIKDEFDLHYRERFQFEVLDNHVSQEAIRDYRNGRPATTFKDIFERLIDLNQRLMWYPEPIQHKLIALDIISSYFLPLYNAKGRRFIYAEKGSGKTRQTNILQNLCCNAVGSPDTTKSSFYRLMESTVWTLLIDDFDSIGEDQRQAVIQHYKTGYKPGSSTLRTKDNSARDIAAMRNYGHVIMNNTTGIGDISQDRTVPIDILKNDNADLDDLETDKEHWQNIVDELYILALERWKTVKSTYNNVESQSLSGRDFEITRDILAIAELVDSDLREKVESHYADRLEQRRFEDVQQKMEFIAVYPFKGREAGHDPIPMKDITHAIIQQKWPTIKEGSEEYDKKKFAISRSLGKFYDKLSGVFSKTKPHNKVHIQLDNSDALDNYLESKGWENEEVYDDLLQLY